MRAKIAVRNWPVRRSASTARLSARQHVARRGRSIAAARTVWRASAVSAAASTPLPQTSPIAIPQTSRVDLRRRRRSRRRPRCPAAPASSSRGEVEPGIVRQRAREQRGLQRLRDRVLALEELRPGQRHGALRDERVEQVALTRVQLARVRRSRARSRRSSRRSRSAASRPATGPCPRARGSARPSRRRRGRRPAWPVRTASATGAAACSGTIARRATRLVAEPARLEQLQPLAVVRAAARRRRSRAPRRASTTVARATSGTVTAAASAAVSVLQALAGGLGAAPLGDVGDRGRRSPPGRRRRRGRGSS